MNTVKPMTCETAALVLIDVQGKLASLMFDRERLLANLRKLVQGARLLGVPLVWTEQNPTRMGGTVPSLLPLLEGLSPLPKMSFGCCGDPAVRRAIEGTGRHQFLLAGIETHVCVYQTAAQLRTLGHDVQVCADAVSSRKRTDLEIGLERIRECGAGITSVESALFEMAQTADHPAFRDLLKIVR